MKVWLNDSTTPVVGSTVTVATLVPPVGGVPLSVKGVASAWHAAAEL